MSFKIADTSTSDLRYYPFVERTVGNNTTVSDITKPSGNETVGNETVTPANITTETPEDVNATPETPEATTPEEPTDNATKPEENSTPGFGVVLGLVGLLGVVYLVRRNN